MIGHARDETIAYVVNQLRKGLDRQVMRTVTSGGCNQKARFGLIRMNPSRHANDPVLVPSGPNLLVMLLRHLLLVVTVCLHDLFFVAIISMASPSWPDLCGNHRSPASRNRWLPCSAHSCLAVRLGSSHSFSDRPSDPSLPLGMIQTVRIKRSQVRNGKCQKQSQKLK